MIVKVTKNIKFWGLKGNNFSPEWYNIIPFWMLPDLEFSKFNSFRNS